MDTLVLEIDLEINDQVIDGDLGSGGQSEHSARKTKANDEYGPWNQILLLIRRSFI